jgi:AAA domain-containing protein/bifunctional DNA primase/polymerase-like protein
MIANDQFVACFGIVPTGDEEDLPALVRNAVRQGFAIVPIAPGAKTPICTLTARQSKAADIEAQRAAQEADEANWETRRHACGIAHAFSDPDVATRVIRRLAKERGAVNIGVEVGRSRLVHVDTDTATELAGFLLDWSAESGIDYTGRRPTVTTPGVMRTDAAGEQSWAHKDGGHFWFTVPEGLDLVALPGSGTLRAESGWVATWKDHQALVPPSVRPEGAYTITGQVEPAPNWLIARIEMAAHSYAERRARQAERIRHDGDPIDAWSASTPWADLLTPDDWTCTGLPDNCGCAIWTRPGDPGHHKSATAHELGCTRFETVTGHGPLHIWTDNPPDFLADAIRETGKKTLTKLEYIAWRDHDGSNPAAMRDLDLGFLGGGDDQAEVDALLDEIVSGSGVVPEPVATETPQIGSGLSAPVDEVPDEFAELRAHPKLLREVEQIYRREMAKQWYDRLRNRGPRADLKARIKAATDRLDRIPDDEEGVTWRIEDLWQQGQTVLLTAQYKAGKTTMVINAIRSLVDGKPFLGQFVTTAATRGVYVVNAEMTGRQFRRWLREAGIENRDRVFAMHVREAGTAAGDILDATSRELLIEELREADAQVLILDPLNPLLSAAGVDENASTEVARWFNALTDVVERSPVEDVLLVHHFGHQGERGRGSSKFMDAPDAIWTYTKGTPKGRHAVPDDDDLLGEIETAAEPRYLAAIGRDVELSKSRVDYDAVTRMLTMPVVGAGPDRRRVERAEMVQEQTLGHIVSFVVASPGITFNALYERAGGNKDTFRAALNDAVRRGLLTEESGARGSRKFTANNDRDQLRPTETNDHESQSGLRPRPAPLGVLGLSPRHPEGTVTDPQDHGLSHDGRGGAL